MRICMASDFFYPNMGGVEEHIFNLSQCLLKRGNKVVVITHGYGDRQGIRYMTNGLKVYYLPIRTCYNQCILPTMVSNVPLLRYILLRERIEVVHGHSAFSALAHETMCVGRLLGMRVVFTDHSLFGFADLSAVFTNKLLQITLSNCNHCICVSHTGKENTVLRAKVLGSNVSVIPNAVDTAHFTPNPHKRNTAVSEQSNLVTVVIISRLVYRKGVDLMAGVILKMKDMQNVRFLIGGDGPKRGLLEEVREKANIQDRVTMLGALEHAQGNNTASPKQSTIPTRDDSRILDESSNSEVVLNVRDVLTKGHIFLNTSLTEAYCMAIVEAASCGLKVVTTRVGGIPEVLPNSLTILTEPTIDAVYDGLMLAIEQQLHKRRVHANGVANGGGGANAAVKHSSKPTVVCPFECNDIVRSLYQWDNVAHRTENVYHHVLAQNDPPFGQKLRLYGAACGSFVVVVAAIFWLLRVLDWLVPVHLIDVTRDFRRAPAKHCSANCHPDEHMGCARPNE